MTPNAKKFIATFALAVTVSVVSAIVIFRGQISLYGVPRISLSLAERLKDTSATPAVVCMIHTTPGSWMTRARAVRHTWGPRCTYSIYFYSNKAAEADHAIRKAPGAVGLDVEHGRGHLTAKTRAGLKYSYEKYGNVAEWYMKGDDDTYLIWENLVSLLDELQPRNTTSTQNATIKPLYLGRQFFTILPHGYMSGGAGYLVNAPAARLLLDGPDKHPGECRRDGGFEDVETGRCLASFGVYPTNTKDEEGKLRFHCSTPLAVLDGRDLNYYIELSGAEFGSPQQKHKEHMLSIKAVTFHYITPSQMLMFDYMRYHLKFSKTRVKRQIGDQHLNLTEAAVNDR